MFGARALPASWILLLGAGAALAQPAQLPHAKPIPVVSPHHAAPVRKHPAPDKHHAAKTVEPPAPKPLPKPLPPPAAPDVGSNTGLHLPRFASLKTDLVNMRSGPGERYPVLWVYRRRDLPVEIEREFDIWRLVEDMDGTKGWVHQATLTGRRGFIITGTDVRTIRAAPGDTADAVAVLKPGVVGHLRSCDTGSEWCQVQVQDNRGWLRRNDFWGALPGEVVQP